MCTLYKLVTSIIFTRFFHLFFPLLLHNIFILKSDMIPVLMGKTNLCQRYHLGKDQFKIEK